MRFWNWLELQAVYSRSISLSTAVIHNILVSDVMLMMLEIWTLWFWSQMCLFFMKRYLWWWCSRETWGLWRSRKLQFREKGERSGRINIAIHKSWYVGPWLHSWSSWQLMTLSSLQSLSILLQKLDAVSICFLIINMKRWTELDWHGEITVLLESDNQQGCALEIGFGSVVVWNSDCIASQTDTLIWGWRLLINYDCVEFEVAKLVNSLVG